MADSEWKETAEGKAKGGRTYVEFLEYVSELVKKYSMTGCVLFINTESQARGRKLFPWPWSQAWGQVRGWVFFFCPWSLH